MRTLAALVTGLMLIRAVAIGGTCASTPAGVVGWWAGEDNATNTVGTNTGTLMNGASFVGGMVGRAFSLSGASQYIVIPDTPSLRFTNAMTVEGWIFSMLAPNQLAGITTKWDGGFNQRSFSFYVSNGQLGFEVSSDGQDRGSADIGSVHSASTIPTNEWVHVCGVYDGATIAVYVNGALQSAAPWTQGIFPGTVPVSIGSALTSGAYFKGRIDELTLYDRALTVDEIQAIYDAGADGKCPAPAPPRIISQPSGQVGYWGGSVTFQVKMAPNPLLPAYQWSLDGFAISWATNATLTLTDLGLYDGGHFQVVITNNLGSVTSNPALLLINPSGVSISMSPTLTITGSVGKSFGIQYATGISDTNVWTTATNFTLSQSVQFWFDTDVDASSSVHPHRFYRVVPLP